MNRSISLRSILFLLAQLLVPLSFASAAVLFGSGTLGPTGVQRTDITNGTVAGTNVNQNVFLGVRFFLHQPAITTQVGGHFVKDISADDSFFAAIVELDDENDFPDSGDLSTSDVIDSSLLTFPEPSAEVFGDLEEPLEPGWYALVFGSGLFGTTGSGVAVRTGSDIGVANYIAYVSSRWRDLVGTSIPFDNHRFLVNGTNVPEHATIVLILLSSISLAWRSQRHLQSDS